jgi:uncharacterized protein YjbI with pentapeptide repeats
MPFKFSNNVWRFIRFACALTLLGMMTPATAQQTAAVANNIRHLVAVRACEGCDLHGANLAGADLSGVNLEAADLSGANLEATNLRGANLSRAILLKARIIDTKLSGANLRMADLSDLDIDQAFESLEIIGAQLEGARFADGVICGPAPNKGGWGCQHP